MPALARGVIDAAEFVGPFRDARPGLQNTAKNWYGSPWQAPSTVLEIGIQLGGVLTVMLFPATALWLPSAMGWMNR